MSEIGKKNERVLRDYLLYKRTTVNSSNKLKDIERYIKAFIDSGKKDLDKFDEKDLIDFINYISKKYSIRALNDIKVFVKNFIKWKFLDYSIRFRNLDKICRSSKAPQAYQPEDMISKEELEKLVQAEHDLKWKTYFLLLFYGGFRPSEVCSLTWKAISFESDGCFIKIYSEKNKQYFDKFIPENVAFYLKKLQSNNSEWVFPSIFKNERANQPMKEKAAYHRLKHLSEIVLKRRISPYVIRHSIATILYNRDDIKDEDAAKQLGHTKNMRSTYDNLSKDKIREKLKKIWIKAEELPPEKKAEFDLMKGEVENLKTSNAELADRIKSLTALAENLVEMADRGEKFTKWEGDSKSYIAELKKRGVKFQDV